jgi:hypothetical protein
LKAILLLLVLATPVCAINHISNISTASGGVTVSGSSPDWTTTGFGTINGLGLGTAPTGTTLYTSGVSGGVLYVSPISVTNSGAAGAHPTVIQAYMSTNFSHSAVLSAEACYPTCASAADYSAISLSSGSPSDVIGQPGVTANTAFTIYVGVFVSNGDGASYLSGSDSATITFDVYDGSTMTLKSTCTLSLNNENVQTAVQFTLATSGAGLTISAASDFTSTWGNVNGLGVGTPTSGLTTHSASGGVVYETPISLLPVYSSFTSTTGTLSVYVSSNFTHSSLLAMKDTGTSGGPYTTISLTSASPTAITTTAASNATITRYLGLFVSNLSGGSAFSGADNATLTYQMTVP